MFEDLDEARLAQAHNAYGLSDHLLFNLRALATSPLEEATSILDELTNFVFHQDLFYEVTPLVVPYFLELLTHDLPIRAGITKVLGSMLSAAGAWTSDDSVATAAAIGRGRAVIEALLDDDSVDLRSAAEWALSMMPGPDREPLLRRLAVETDDDSRVSLLISLAKLGEKVVAENEKEGSRAADVARVLAAEAPIDDATAAAFARLLAARPWPLLNVYDGLPSWLAIAHLHRLGAAEPRTFGLLRDAYLVQWNIPFAEEPQLYNERLISQTDEEYARARAGQRANWPIDDIIRALRDIEERVTDPADRRWILENIDLYRPRNGLEAQRDFLRGDGVLDEIVHLDGVRATIADHLLADVTPEHRDRLMKAFQATLSPARFYELGLCLLGHHLDHEPWLERVTRWCAPLITDERTIAYLADHETNYWIACFALAPAIAERRPPPPPLDALACDLLQEGRGPEWVEWVRTFPSPRREQLVAKLPVVVDAPFAAVCDPELLGNALLDTFLDPSCSWTEDVAISRLSQVPTSLLESRCADCKDGRRRAVDAALEERRPITLLVLKATPNPDDKLHLVLTTTLDELVIDTLDLDALVTALQSFSRPVIKLVATCSGERAYELQSTLADRVVPLDIIDKRRILVRARKRGIHVFSNPQHSPFPGA